MGELHQSTLDTSLGPAYTRNNTPDPWGGFEGTCVLVTGKTQVAQVWIQFASWNVGSLSRKADEIVWLWRDVVLMFAACRNWDEKKVIGNRYKLWCNVGSKAENGVLFLLTVWERK